MQAMVGAHGFALAAGRASGGVYCGADGVFVGSIPLLQGSGAAGAWSVRPIAELNDELSTHYRLPIDIAAKANALQLIAHALNRGDLAMAAIATVQMRFPDPPLSKALESREQVKRRAAELHRCGLLKWIWDPLKHPRTDAPPNPGWFASTGGAAPQPSPFQATPRPQLAVLPNDAVIPLCLASTGGLGDCLGGEGGIGGEGRDATSDFIEPNGRNGGEHSDPGEAPIEPAKPSPSTGPKPLPEYASPQAASSNESQPPKIGSFPVPDDLTYGTTNFGIYAHEQLAKLLDKLYPRVKFILRLGRGQKGIDVEVPDDPRLPPSLREKSLELKPRTPSGERRFYRQKEEWGVPVDPLSYDQDGNIYYGFR